MPTKLCHPNGVFQIAYSSPVKFALNLKQFSIKWHDIPLDKKFTQHFNGESCQSLSDEQKQLQSFLCNFPLFKRMKYKRRSTKLIWQSSNFLILLKVEF